MNDEPYTLDYYQCDLVNDNEPFSNNQTYEFTHFENNGQLLYTMMYKINSRSVHCIVTIDEVSIDQSNASSDYANKLIQNPNARLYINDAKNDVLLQTICLMFGPVLSLYDNF